MRARCAFLLVAAGIGGGLTLGPADASASVLHRCAARSIASCGRVDVPLDRSGTVPGRIPLFVVRVPARLERRGTILFLAGGPGQAAARFALDLAGRSSPLPASVRRHYDLLVPDQRGTGRSGALRCPPLQRANILDAGPEAADCARRLGPGRPFYTTADSVEDIEAVRAALGVEKLTVYGVSYGTRVGLAYAAAHPDRVERLLLDSVVGPHGIDPLYPDSFAAVSRVLRDLCRNHACDGVTPDPVDDVAALVGRMREGPLIGYVNDESGVRRPTRLDGTAVFNLLVASDLTLPTFVAQLPGALRAARRGDTAPLMRLARQGLAADGAPTDPTAESSGLYAATVCEESRLPWGPFTPQADRPAAAAKAVADLGDGAFAPFDVATALGSDELSLCARWPSQTRPAPVLRPPDVPALLLDGEDDLRTPLEGARALAALMPRATLVAVPNTGHDTLDADLSPCASRAVERFFAGLAQRPCRTGRRLVPVTPLPPVTIAYVPHAPGVPGRPGRTLCAVAQTLFDTDLQVLDAALSGASGTLQVPALRGGDVLAAVNVSGRGIEVALEYEHSQYVAGVTVSGPRIGDAPMRVAGFGAAAGTLRVAADGRAVGHLGHRSVRANLRSCLPRRLADLEFERPARRRLAAAALALRGPRPRLRVR